MIVDEAQGVGLTSDLDAAFEIDLRGVPVGRKPAADGGRAPIGGYQTLVKPVFDRLVAVLLVVVTVPLMLFVAALVFLDIGRPVIFRQTRVGRDGQPFTVYKFTTMTSDRRIQSLRWEQTDRRTCHKRGDDPRLTPIGRFLRQWSLDELPQFWNVVRGNMSLVGPRPELPSIVAGFAPWQHARHAVKPGLTGFWQIYARGDGSVMHQRTELDIAYVRQIGFITDLKILLLTIPAIVGLRKGI